LILNIYQRLFDQPSSGVLTAAGAIMSSAVRAMDDPELPPGWMKLFDAASGILMPRELQRRRPLLAQRMALPRCESRLESLTRSHILLGQSEQRDYVRETRSQPLDAGAQPLAGFPKHG
jgi:hypothetical protein